MKMKDLIGIIIIGFIISAVIRFAVNDIDLDLRNKVSSSRGERIVKEENLELARYSGNYYSYWNAGHLLSTVQLHDILKEEKLIVWLSFDENARVENYKIVNEGWEYPEIDKNPNLKMFLRSLMSIQKLNDKWTITDGILTLQYLSSERSTRVELHNSTSKKDLEEYVEKVKYNNLKITTGQLK